MLNLNGLYRPIKSDIKRMARVLANAFQDYPLFIWVIPNAEDRRKKLHYGFSGLVRYGLKYGEVYATSDKFEGVIIYLHSNSGPMTTWRWLKCGFLKVIFKWGRQSVNRWSSVGDSTEEFRNKNAPDPHMYLLTIGVDPPYQEKGYGSRLITSGLKRLDAKNIPAYLETFKNHNVSIYRHFKFHLCDECHLPNTDLTLYSMLHLPSNI